MLYKVEVQVNLYPNLSAGLRTYFVLVQADSERSAEDKACALVTGQHLDGRKCSSAACLGTAEYVVFDDALQILLVA